MTDLPMLPDGPRDGDSAGVLWFAGVRWTDPAGTDHRLVPALAARRPVLWIDPPSPALRWQTEEDTVSSGVVRVRTTSLPGTQRPLLRAVARGRAARAARIAAGAHGPIAATVVARPLTRFPRGLPGARILYATDDWVAGAGLMGVSERLVRRILADVLNHADAVVAVSPTLLDVLAALGPRRADVPWIVLPNGAPEPSGGSDASEPVAVLAGQLNERLDLDSVEAVLRSGIPVRVFGRIVGRDPRFLERLQTVLAHPKADFRGAVDPTALREELARAAVGLTPYRQTPFNRSSFPLKTLDYLAAGLPVVSTELSASRWLDSSLVRVADGGPEHLARLVQEAVHTSPDPGRAAAARALASSHSWHRRASDLDDLISSLAPGSTASSLRG